MSGSGREILDLPSELPERDPQGMLKILGRFDQQLDRALEIGQEVTILPGGEPVEKVLLCGMGGSAIGGDFLRAYLGQDIRVPFLVNRNYSLPGFVDTGTLVLVASYSGQTEGTLSSYAQAREKGARVICLTSGGTLGQLAQEHGVPCARIPEGYPPRSALGFCSIPFLVCLSRLGLVADRSEDLRRSIELVTEKIKNYGPLSAISENPAKHLALSLKGQIPIIYGSDSHLEMVAVRWRGQFSENGKQLAYSSTLPEMNHNEIEGWTHPPTLLRQLVPIFLRDREDHPKTQARIDVTRDLLSEKVDSTLEYWTDGESWIDRLWSLILLGDYASVYLAFLNQIDPTPVKIIERLKTRLKELA